MKIVPDETGFVEERSGLESRRRNPGDVGGEEEQIGGDLAELSVFLAELGGGGGPDAGGVGNVDACVPEAVAEFPDLKLGRVRERSE